MNRHNNLPSSGEAFGGPANFSYQNDRTQYPSYFQGMSVQTVNSLRSVYFSRSTTNQNNTHPVIPLDEFHATSLTQSVFKSFDKSDLTVIPTAILDEYVPWHPANTYIDGELPSSLSCCLNNQSCFSRNGPDIRQPVPANKINPDNHLTNLLTELANPEDSRPDTVANPLNLQQATSDNQVNTANIVVDKSSQAKRKRVRRNNPVYAERQRERRRQREKERCRNDPAYAEHRRERNRNYQRERYQNDPAYAERERERKRKLQRECRKDPTRAEHQRERRRERRRELQRERHNNEPAYAESLTVCNNTYNKMQKTTKEEASKPASFVREQYLQSFNSSEYSDDLPQTPNPAETTQNSNVN